MLECKFRPINEFPILTDQNKKKLARYHGSIFTNVKDDYYVIAAYIDGDFEKVIETMKEEEIIKECIEFLNEQKKLKKVKKKKEFYCIYGDLLNYKSELKKDKEGKLYIEALLMTSEKKNSLFWGEGFEN
jgi:hypothetical protein